MVYCRLVRRAQRAPPAQASPAPGPECDCGSLARIPSAHLRWRGPDHRLPRRWPPAPWGQRPPCRRSRC
eukprot:9673985-Lingulodinium_polyedra.AAC.1